PGYSRPPMLAIISDLHLQHTSSDILRYPVDGEVHELRIERNITADAFRRFCSVIDESARRRHSTEVEVVFAGDIFELLRTPLWFTADDPTVRPTRKDLGPDERGNALRDRVHQVLDAIEHECAGCWPTWAGFVREGGYTHYGVAQQLPAGVKVKVRYVPGNHDRLAAAWPSVRARVRGLLCILDEPPEAPFLHLIDRPRGEGGRGYGVRVRHGHEYDDWNFGRSVAGGAALKASEQDYLLPSLGDHLTIDVATRLATAFRAYYGRELRRADSRGEAMRRLYVALTEFDDVRPFSLLMAYLSGEFGQGDEATFETLRPVLRDVVAASEASAFFRAQAKRFHLPRVAVWGIAEALKSAPLSLLGKAVEVAVGLSGHPEALQLGGSTPPGEAARLEPGLDAGEYETIIAGHTHNPDQVPLPSGHKRSPGGRTREDGLFFLDSGTWRTSIRSGAGNCFGRVRACTMVLAYDAGERAYGGDGREGRRFETWTGHLASGSVGPKLERLGALSPSTQRLVFTRLEVLHVDEGDGLFGGAELRLACGVDGEVRTLEADRVRDGAVVDLCGLAPVPLWPQLDGELWFNGHEEDYGTSPIDPDDQLPWALRPLPRDSGRFLPGEGQLAVGARRGDRLLLHYRVEDGARGK
ncbi:MAG: hypothetical protein ACYC8T_09565, partial [Myxococcaceae bacterium]